MRNNMGTLDRSIRIVIAMAIIVLYFTHLISGTTAIILLVISGIFILTSFMSFCPLYVLLGINTCVVKNKK
ncbi:hypothetical protein HDC92_002876 [Pedobacter sp. AK017]|uniref:YgaP family membrane protein n=1 Tax=Pedobacter sp. AK017 TaxID=2723073 RepID=UPI00160F4A6E|nr:DUF2892 domain-containing protein [Pedobacter sp. AK017]MBB5439189.1 hypothetical protein [Pedobacter sp. AK017]